MLVAAGACATACARLEPFDCKSDAACVLGSDHGRCESNGSCSFVDATCPFYRRYADASGDLSGTCIGDVQPVFPIRAAFYKASYPEAWSESSAYKPCLGQYKSSDTALIARHIDALSYGNFGAAIVEWRADTDVAFAAILRAARGDRLRFAAYVEEVADGDAATMKADLQYLHDHYAAEPAYLRIGGRFVVFVRNGEAGCSTVTNWMNANHGVGAFLVLKVFTDYDTCSDPPDGWHQYAPTTRSDQQASYSYSLSPGYWKYGEATAQLPRDETNWASAVQKMSSAAVSFQLVTTFNEWSEGSAIECATTWQSKSGYGAYLDVLHATVR